MKTENNRIIAEFMDYKIQKDPTERFFGYYKQPLGAWTKEIDLAFHHDWNWLMEVVEKIESLDFNFNITSGDATALKNHGAIYQTLIYRIDGTKKIEAVYNTCVEFIKWYNEQKQN